MCRTWGRGRGRGRGRRSKSFGLERNMFSIHPQRPCTTLFSLFSRWGPPIARMNFCASALILFCASALLHYSTDASPPWYMSIRVRCIGLRRRPPPPPSAAALRRRPPPPSSSCHPRSSRRAVCTPSHHVTEPNTPHHPTRRAKQHAAPHNTPHVDPPTSRVPLSCPPPTPHSVYLLPYLPVLPSEGAEGAPSNYNALSLSLSLSRTFGSSVVSREFIKICSM